MRACRIDPFHRPNRLQCALGSQLTSYRLGLDWGCSGKLHALGVLLNEVTKSVTSILKLPDDLNEQPRVLPQIPICSASALNVQRSALSFRRSASVGSGESLGPLLPLCRLPLTSMSLSDTEHVDKKVIRTSVDPRKQEVSGALPGDDGELLGDRRQSAEKILVRKVDTRLLPIIVVIFIMNYIDVGHSSVFNSVPLPQL